MRPGCGIALYGLSPFGTDPADDGLEPVLAWRSELAQVKRLVAGREHGLRPDLRRRSGDVDRARAGRLRGRLPARPDRHGGARRGSRRRVVGTVSMDSFAVELPGRAEPGTPVTLIGDGLLAEEHARHAGTITYELVDGHPHRSRPRATRTVVDA